LRSLVGKNLGIRLTPTIEFIADAIPENAAHLDDLLAKAKAKDAEVAAAAAGAAYAGEADPYRKPEDALEDEALEDGADDTSDDEGASTAARA
jgi:ribosome-binding factor A